MIDASRKRLITKFITFMLLLVLIQVTVPSCAVPTESVTSGIKGIVMIGPISPVEKEGEINEKPYSGAVILIMDSTGKKEIASVKSDQNGRFEIYLAPDTYQLLPQTPDKQPLPVAEPQTVVVTANKFTEVTIPYDSGIR